MTYVCIPPRSTVFWNCQPRSQECLYIWDHLLCYFQIREHMHRPPNKPHLGVVPTVSVSFKKNRVTKINALPQKGIYTSQELEWIWLWFKPTFNHNYKHLYLQTPSTCWAVDLTASIILPLVQFVEWIWTNDVWILVKSLCMSDCILHILSHALALKFSRSCCIVTTNTTEPKKSYYNNRNHFQLNLAI